MKTAVKEDFTISISEDIVKDIQKFYEKEDYTVMVENFLKLVIPHEGQTTRLSSHLRGCAASSGFADKTDKEIRKMMYQEKYGL